MQSTLGCPLFIQCTLECPLFIQCTLGCPLVIQCTLGCPLFMQCTLGYPLFIQCYVLQITEVNHREIDHNNPDTTRCDMDWSNQRIRSHCVTFSIMAHSTLNVHSKSFTSPIFFKFCGEPRLVCLWLYYLCMVCLWL